MRTDYEEWLVRRVLKALGEKARLVKALVLFGSRAMGEEPSWASDVDLLIVLDDRCADRDLEEVRRRLSGLSYSPRPRGLLGHLFWSLEKATGMFHSPFVCRERDLRSLDFKRIFGTSQLLTTIMAPVDIVLGSVLRTSKVIYGRLPGGLGEPEVRGALQLLKNLITCFSLALGAYFFCPIANEAQKYILEALKWSIYATTYYTTGDIGPLTELVEALGLNPPWPWDRLSKEFVRARKELGPAGPMLLRALPGVLNLHLAALRSKYPFHKHG